MTVYNRWLYLKCKLAGVVVHSAAVHEGEGVSDRLGVEDLVLIGGADTSIGHGGAHH